MGEKAVVQKKEEAGGITAINGEELITRMDEIFDAVSRRAFEIFASNGREPGHDLQHWFKAEKELFHPTRVNIAETPEIFEIRAEVPGFNEKEIQIYVGPQRLTIAGKREKSQRETTAKTVYSETCSDELYRVVELPSAVDSQKATASLKDGILSLTIPKAANTHTAPIKSATAA
jgi:HSP20 family protein